METKTKAFVSTQLLAVLPPIALKVACYICNWQNSTKGIMLYEHRFARTLKLTETEVRISIQTLINLKLIDLTRIDGKWRIELNVDEFAKYYKIPMDRVIEHEGYKLADKITYDEVEKENKDFELASISDADLEKMVKELQRRREEKKKGCQVVYPTDVDTEFNDLPF